ncbi:MAG TPA: inositol monophosphatase family protein [Actinomycetota bacterium]|nr:inositol monophosphatase family protein [Actinomycetota bacterium]
MPDLQHELDVAREVAAAGAATAASYFGSDVPSERKEDGTLVSEADRATEETLRSGIAAAFPDHNILGEEGGLQGAAGGPPRDGAPTWVVDPIDGTNNFLAGIPVWGTLVGLRVDGASVVGVAHAPAIGEVYEAALGSGARLNGRPIEVVKDVSLEDATIAYASVQSFFDAGLKTFFEEIVGKTWRSRGFGDFWGHMLVARGAVHVMIETDLSIWDVVALQPIVAEAGGTLTTLGGDPWDDHGSCLSTNGTLHDEVLALLRTTTPGWTEPR